MRPRPTSSARAGFTLLEMTVTIGIVALAATLVLPVLSALSSTSTARAAAARVAELVNRRIALARAGGGPVEISSPGDSTLVVTIAEELSDAAAQSGANDILGTALPGAAPGTGRAATAPGKLPVLSGPSASGSTGDETVLETLDLAQVKVQSLYVQAATTGQAKDLLDISSSGACDEALIVLSSGDATAYVSVRGFAGRARVYDTLPPYLATNFEAPQNGSTPVR